ncbi:MAG TPA: DUF2341 domain-containing protein, partial [Candidatus Aenigmarchaeota archaeon]|nr:DUF2341 domain-containing protein [Candidatus Aenigmarchaeota archaeon]
MYRKNFVIGKGMVFSIDIIIGLSLLLIILFTNYYIFSVPGIYEEKLYDRLSLISSDLLNTLSELKVYEALNLSPTIERLINNLTEDEQETAVLNLILTLWAQGEDENNETKKELARNITYELINSIGNFSFNLTILVGNSTVYGFQNILQDKEIVVSTLIESTYSPEKPKYGYIARAYLTEIDKEDSSYLYFGGFVGQGNISSFLKLPSDANITQAYLEAYAGASFDIYINGNFSGNFSPSNFSNFSSNVKGFINISSLRPGNNTMEIRFSSGNIEDWFIGGGFLRVDYKTSKFYEERDTGKIRYYFPGINGLINLYDGFYIPGDLNNMSIYLHYKNNVTGSTIYLTIANSTLYKSNVNGEQNISLNSSQILSNLTAVGLNYSYLSRKTIPIKLGTETLALEHGLGASDAILITDVSGSMGACDVSSNCTPGICDSSPPCHRTRINVAKEVDKDFVNGMLNISGNRVSLVAYETGIHKYHELTENNETLINEIDSYTPGGYTCICCGIKMAIEALKKPYLLTLINNNSEWLYNINYPDSEPPEINGSKWNEINYNDTNWSSGSAILGFENISWNYRRAINVSNIVRNLTDYQILIQVNFSQEFSQGKIQQYCNDTRFTWLNTSGEEQEIPYWIEECNLTANDIAKIWIKVPFIENNTNTTLYIYYGNPLATSESNRDAVFDFYDDFENGILDSSKWLASNSNYAGVGSYTSYSGIYSMYTRWNTVEVTTRDINLNTTPIEISYWIRRGDDSFSEDPDVGEDLIVEYLNSSGTWVQLDSFAGSGIPGEIYSQKHYLSSGLHQGFKLKFRQTDGSGSDYDYWHIDDVIIRKYINPEPTSYIEEEEQISKYFGDITTFLGNNGGNYYFRKKFYLGDVTLSRIDYLYIYLLSDDKAEVYLNGNLIYNETQEHNATYWNLGLNQIFYDGFENGINSSIWIRGGSVYPYWIIYSNPVIEGLYSSGNNDIGDNQESWIKTTINISQDAILHYYWKVSSENNWDFSSFYLNNLVVSRIDGEMGWR